MSLFCMFVRIVVNFALFELHLKQKNTVKNLLQTRPHAQHNRSEPICRNMCLSCNVFIL